ncbi:MAG: hypothetical protein GOP50_05700 [Candidatus Heimdallarchaeota archaeon]|nr:hypothetical protein [Candidatus Heimdallarchaeota archaeon]
MKVERTDDIPSFYAESIQMVHSVAGFKMIVFKDKAEYKADPSTGPEALMPKSIIKEIITEINFSPHQLKILSKIIQEQLKAFEARFGEIALPEPNKKQDNTTASFV